jgi:hypothetical protein
MALWQRSKVHFKACFADRASFTPRNSTIRIQIPFHFGALTASDLAVVVLVLGTVEHVFVLYLNTSLRHSLFKVCSGNDALKVGLTDPIIYMALCVDKFFCHICAPLRSDQSVAAPIRAHAYHFLVCF